MDIYIIFPIGGLLSIIAGLVIFVILGLMSIGDPQIVSNFAQNNTVTVLVIIAIITVLISFCIYAYYGLRKATAFGLFFNLSLILSYLVCLDWAYDLFKYLGEVVIAVLIMAPFIIIFLIVEVLLVLLPNLLFFIPEFLKIENYFTKKIYPWIICIISSSIYIFLICYPRMFRFNLLELICK